MYGYRAEFSYEGKMRMILSRKPIVHSDELDSYQVKMLHYNKVSHLLPVEMREVDFEVDFLYDISGKKMLEQVLRSARMNSMQYFEWMYQLVGILEGCHTYMLYPNQIMLHEQFIFVDGHFWNGNLFVVYVPLIEPLHSRAAMEGLKRLSILLSSYVMHWNGDGFQRLVQLLAQEEVSLAKIRDLLRSLLIGTSSSNPMDNNYQLGNNHQPEQAQLTSLSTSTPGINSDYKEMRLESITNRVVQQGDVSYGEVRLGWNPPSTSSRDKEMPSVPDDSISPWSTSAQKENEKDRECERNEITNVELEQATDLQVIGKRYTVTITGAVIITTVLGWKFGYLSNPTVALFIASLAWSICFVAIGALCLTRFPSIWLNKLLSYKVGTSIKYDGLKSEQNPSEVIFRRQQSLMKQPQTESYLSMDDYYTQLANYTTILDTPESDSTVILGEAEYYEEDTQCSPYLQQLDETGLAVIGTLSLETFPFIIGRAEQGVNFCDESIGVSKHHCEFICSDSGICKVRDLGSRNGTELQEELLIPYKLYPLKDGDKLSLAHSHYLYHVGTMDLQKKAMKEIVHCQGELQRKKSKGMVQVARHRK